jgi:hypothetical protein
MCTRPASNCICTTSRRNRAAHGFAQAWIDDGDITAAPIDSTFSLAVSENDQLHAAFARMKSRRTVGKIVFTFDPPQIS